MILRNSALRYCRRAFAAPARRPSSLCLLQQAAAFSTGDKRPPLRTTFADPPPPPAPEDSHRHDPAAAAAPAAPAAAAPAPSQPAPKKPAPKKKKPARKARRARDDDDDDFDDDFENDREEREALLKKKATVPVDESIARNFHKFTKMQSAIGGVGSTVDKRFDPSSLLRDPPKPEDVTLELLMASQTHMGHHTSLWNPANQRYIYGARAGIHIISLEETAAALRRAARVVEEVAYLGGLMLFVGNGKGQAEVTARSAELAGACHLFSRWVPGTITNRDQILGKGPGGGGNGLRVADERDRTLPGFEGHLGERRPLLPELVVVLNPLANYPMLQECAQENIPTIGLIDTDADPTQVTYVIPGNDDSLRSVSLIAGVLGRAGERGQARRKADAEKGICTWRNADDIQKWMFDEHHRAVQAREEAMEEARKAREAGLGLGLGGEDGDGRLII
ncbi:hypothetical protein KVR01_007147 [Diaporthe batatas]|uniref:mitochondrial 37S ribosomal protein MRP4 n=1 Tax=Diaporthe batatas TaxID=748121 RepID=UPI001D03A2F4|nr:mitochondrial 37S ribosomal protein MRP4 [Diaporthe batatas]KAG8162669.1 hypothetical protein KVR01_007147 [Diaporthe batatas]